MLTVGPEQTGNSALGGKGCGLARLAACGAATLPTVALLPEEGEAALDEGLEALGDPSGAGSYAVRSSGWEEDGPQRSFAGQLESYLRVSGRAALWEAVRSCRASGGSDRAVRYSGKAQPVTVLIQPMVEASYAGVLFTCDPISGSRNHLTLEAVPGTSQQLLAGHVRAISVRLDRSGRVLGADPPFPAGRLGRLALELESRLQTLGMTPPLDFEWALQGEEVVWLQVRPVTARGVAEEVHYLSPGELPSLVAGETLWTSMNAREALPGVATPLFQDVCPPMLQAGFEAAARMLGVRPSWGAPLVSFEQGRAYLNVTEMEGMVRALPLRNPEVLVGKLLGLPTEPPEFRPSLRLLRPMATLAGRVLTLEPAYRSFVRRELSEFPSGPPPSGQPQEAGRRIRALLDLSELFSLHALGSGLYTGLYAELEALCEPHGVSPGGFLQGLGRLRFGSSAAALRDLAAALAPCRERVYQPDGSLRTDWERELRARPAGWRALQDFLAEFGHLGTGTIDLSAPDWSERPERVLQLVGALIERGETAGGAAYLRYLRERRGASIRELEGRLRGWKRLRFRLLLALLHWAAPYRENLKFYAHRRLSMVRRELLELGRRRLGNAEDVLYLTGEELESLLAGHLQRAGTAASDGGGQSARPTGELEGAHLPGADPGARHGGDLEGAHPTGADLDARLAERRVREGRWRRLGYPLYRVTGPRGSRVVYPRWSEAREFRGTPASPGVTRGTARVLLSLEEAPRLQPGEVLVTMTTDPSWTPLFSLARAVVVEVGSALSHGAVVAREVGIPAVVGLPGLLSAVQDGQVVEVDGTSGLVRLGEPGQR